ncbi:hypothetical protein WMY93_007461 [Mugilogobius chulae]|uniref:Uncharacterized protein n=1 Tax=Mugilogobius chulae TaxID=88201 RepID=A0AAW0PD39_9GOBI
MLPVYASPGTGSPGPYAPRVRESRYKQSGAVCSSTGSPGPYAPRVRESRYRQSGAVYSPLTRGLGKLSTKFFQVGFSTILPSSVRTAAWTDFCGTGPGPEQDFSGPRPEQEFSGPRPEQEFSGPGAAETPAGLEL